MTWKLYALVSGGTVLATYLMSTPAAVPGRVAPAAPRVSARPISSTVDIQELAARLHARVRAETSYREPGRDLFRFVAREPRQQVISPKTQAHELIAPVVSAPLPPLTLSGIATDHVDGAMQRTAVLSTPAGILMVKEGESVAGLYRVLTIDEVAVELEATADGSRRTLRLSGR